MAYLQPGEHTFASHRYNLSALVVRRWVLDTCHLENCRGNVHNRGEFVGDFVGAEIGIFQDTWNTDAAFRRVGFVQTRWSGSGLRPARTIPDEAVRVANIVVAVVVVFRDVGHEFFFDHLNQVSKCFCID